MLWQDLEPVPIFSDFSARFLCTEVLGPAGTYAVFTLIFYHVGPENAASIFIRQVSRCFFHVTGALDQPMCLPADALKNATHDDHRRLGGGASEHAASDYTAKCPLEAVLKAGRKPRRLPSHVIEISTGLGSSYRVRGPSWAIFGSGELVNFPNFEAMISG